MDFIRKADWLNSGRVRAYALMLALASFALLANSYIKAMGADGTDFLAFWGAGHVTAAGDPAAAYDLAAQERVQTGTGSEGWFAFVNPPPFLFAVTPFGALKIQELRKKAQTQLGDDFDIREFHAQVLDTGSLPMPVLEAKIDRWIASK